MKKILLLILVTSSVSILVSCNNAKPTTPSEKEVQSFEHYDTVKNATLIYLDSTGFVKHIQGMSVLHGFVKQDSTGLKWTAPPTQGDYLDNNRKVLNLNILQALVKQVPAPIPPPTTLKK